MTIHKEGYNILVKGFIAIALILLAFSVLFPGFTWWHLMVYLTGLALLVWLIAFFRSPRRLIMQNPSHIISPADGKVVVIEEVHNPIFSDQAVRQISVFMSPFNVHVNRYPASGKVLSATHHPGKYLVAWHPKSSLLNERTSILMKTVNDDLIMTNQIAGVMAQRIVCYAKDGMEVEQGAELGFIKFGSRLDIFLSLKYRVCVNLGDKVRGGVNVLASLD